MHATALVGMTSDVETQSGQIVQSKEISAWQEYYEKAIYRTETYYTTDGKGHRTRHTREVFSHWSPRTRWHDVNWQCYSNISTSYSITREHHYKLEKLFNDRQAVKGDRRTGEHNSRMIGGDPNDYVSNNKTGYIEPITKHASFENRIKAAPSVFSFVKPPPNTVFSYPENNNPFNSDRLVGSAILLDKLAFDQMNARLGPKKKVNVIMVGFSNKPSTYGQMQQAEWIGGKKNDIVITFGGKNSKPDWVYVFGWTEKDIVKRDLESIVLKNGVTNETMRLIEEEIVKNYVLKDWSKFDYIQIEPPTWAYIVYGIVLLISQAGFYVWAFSNFYDKNNYNRHRYGY